MIRRRWWSILGIVLVLVGGPLAAGGRAVAGGPPGAVATGTVRAWGNNGNGELGDGGTTYSAAPVDVVGLDGVVSVAAGRAWSLALRADGGAWSWGFNTVGQLGDGTLAQRLAPVPVFGLTDLVGVAAGGSHGLALGRDGAVWAWGSNDQGQLGGTIDQDPHPYPRRVAGLPAVVAVAAGEVEGLALAADGTVWRWGYGQVRGGFGTTSATPAPVAGLPAVVAIAAGSELRFALTADGAV